MDDWARVLLYGTFDGFTYSTDDSLRITVVLDGGEKVEVPEECVVSADEMVNKYKIKLKDVIERIENFDLGTKAVWINEILNKLGSDYGLHKYHAGYKQGKFDGSMEREKVTVPQFVAGWLNYCKLTGVDLYHAFEMGNLYLDNYAYQKDYPKLKGYFETENNQDLFARAWLDGYTVEEGKRYTIRLKNTDDYLVKTNNDDYRFYNNIYTNRRKHTRKEIEKSGFGWVFDCEGIEIEEVKE